MHYLGLALTAEGPSDYRLLGSIILRTAEDICLSGGQSPVEIGPILELEDPTPGGDYYDRLVSAANAARGGFSIALIHRDGAGNPAVIRENSVRPIAERLSQELEIDEIAIVAVVPVRESEAWALADGDAVREAFGTSLPDSVLEIPSRPRDVESLTDPKAVLDQAYRRVLGGRRSRRSAAAGFLEPLGDLVRLERLRGVPAFRDFEGELREALEALGFLR